MAEKEDKFELTGTRHASLRVAAEDFGVSKQPALRPVFNKVAPQLVRPFQKALKSLSPSVRKKVINTYFKSVKLNGHLDSPKNKKLIRDTLVLALIRDRGWLEFVAEQILDGSESELRDLLGTQVKEKTGPSSVVQSKKKKKASASVTYPTLKDISDADLTYPISLTIQPKSSLIVGRLASVARNLSLSNSDDRNTVITLVDDRDLSDLIDGLKEESVAEAKRAEAQMHQDYDPNSGISEDDWVDTNLSEYLADVDEPVKYLVKHVGL